jgi:hypothetical protein
MKGRREPHAVATFSGAYCSLAEPCEAVGAAPTAKGITCDNA